MSSEDNKSKSVKSDNINLLSPVQKTPKKIFKEQNKTKDNIIKQHLFSSKSSKQKTESFMNPSDSTITSKPNDETNHLQSEFTSPLNENNKYTYFQSKKINMFDKKDILDKPCCCCTKTKCIKKYCECFANNRFCKDCHCIDCMNKYIYLNNNNNNSRESLENEKIFCTCTKSNCVKKYCECYKSGKKCRDKCRCVNCLNNMSPTFTIINNNSNNNDNINLNEDDNNMKEIINKQNINLDEEKSYSRKFSSSEDSSGNYKIQRISVFINQYQTLVNVEKFSDEDMRLLSKKRLYDK